MLPEEIRKWKRSVLKALETPDLGNELRASFSSTAALWEIALQLAIHNERESRTQGRLREELIRSIGLNVNELRRTQKRIAKNKAQIDANTAQIDRAKERLSHLVPSGEVREIQQDLEAVTKKLRKTGRILDSERN
jgi:hypothetical protein